MSALNTADYDYPTEASASAWFEIYRAEEKGSNDMFEDLKLFMSWLELKGIFGTSMAEAAGAVEAWHNRF